MIRIVGLQKSDAPQKEFILLQNQGALRINLRGHLVMSDSAFEQGLTSCAHAFSDDALIPPGMYVLLLSGVGESRWVRTKDQSLIYYTYMNRDQSVWEYVEGQIHILNRQHTYAERAQQAVLLR